MYSLRTQSRGLTVLEVVVGIVVTVVALGLLLAVIPAKSGGRRLKEKNTANQLVVAVNAYYTEYAEWPQFAPDSSGSQSETEQWVGDPSMGAKVHNNALLFTLRAIPKGPNANHRINYRRIDYFGDKVAEVWRGKPRSGLFDRDENGQTPPADLEGCLYDQWGVEYGIVVDASNDDRIDLSPIYQDFAGDKRPKKRVGAFSSGKDRALGHKGDRTYRKDSDVSDDVVSWE